MIYKNQYVGGLWGPVKYASLRYQFANIDGLASGMAGVGGSLRNATVCHALPPVIARKSTPQSAYLRPANGGGIMDIFKSALSVGKNLISSLMGTNTNNWTYLRPG